MTTSKLVGQRVQLLVSDPWEFGTQCGAGPFAASVESAERDHMLLRLDHPIDYRGVRFLAALARPRHSPVTDSLVTSGSLPVNLNFLTAVMTDISDLTEQAERGMLAAIGTIEIGGTGRAMSRIANDPRE